MSLGKLGLIGYGNMGSAIVKGIVDSGLLKPSDIRVYDSDPQKAHKAEKAGHLINKAAGELGIQTETVIVAVKPKDIPLILKELQGGSPDTLIVSIAAGVMLKTIETVLRNNPVIRVMPNTPCMVSAGMNVIVRGTKAREDHVDRAKEIFSSVGAVLEVPETMIDAVTGLSGSGPCYVAVMIDALADAGVKVGLPRPVALKLASQTVYGSAKMIIDREMQPAELRDMVTSPGGTSIAGIHALEARSFRAAIIDAVEAACNKSKEMSKQ